MQSFALISDKDSHIKMACGDKRAAAKIAILDPLLTLTQPHSVTVLTGIDAISHAVETCVTTKRDEISVEFSIKAWKALAMNFSKVLTHPESVKARTKMQLGAAHAGIAIENSMLGAAHAKSLGEVGRLSFRPNESSEAERSAGVRSCWDQVRIGLSDAHERDRANRRQLRIGSAADSILR
jgi:hypothetical protein